MLLLSILKCPQPFDWGQWITRYFSLGFSQAGAALCLSTFGVATVSTDWAATGEMNVETFALSTLHWFPDSWLRIEVDLFIRISGLTTVKKEVEMLFECSTEKGNKRWHIFTIDPCPTIGIHDGFEIFDHELDVRVPTEHRRHHTCQGHSPLEVAHVLSVDEDLERSKTTVLDPVVDRDVEV